MGKEAGIRVNDTVVASFWVSRPADFPDAADYIGMLKLLDASCRAAGMRHVVLTDMASSAMLPREMERFESDLPRNLLQSTTAAQAEWVREGRYRNDDTVFVGADCLVLHDFRPFLRPADLSICTFVHRSLWIMNGFIHVPAASRTKVVPIFDKVARGTRPLPAKTCDDMMSWERALAPRPKELWSKQERAGLTVRFLPEPIWNERPLSADEPYLDAHILHFRGAAQKPMFFDWVARHRPELIGA